MSVESFLVDYGYPVLFLALLLGGDSMMVAVGFLTHQGHFVWPQMLGVAFLGAFAKDQILFSIGKRGGESLLANRPRWQVRASAVRTFLDRRRFLWMLFFRFIAGLAMATPLTLGASGFSRKRFMAIDAVSVALWVGTLGLVGFGAGKTLQSMIHNLKAQEGLVLLILAVVGALIFWIGLRLFHHKVRSEPA